MCPNELSEVQAAAFTKDQGLTDVAPVVISDWHSLPMSDSPMRNGQRAMLRFPLRCHCKGSSQMHMVSLHMHHTGTVCLFILTIAWSTTLVCASNPMSCGARTNR
jgi:hypothetical protein